MMTADLLHGPVVDPFLRRWRTRVAPALGPGGSAIVGLVRSPVVRISGLVSEHALCDTIDEVAGLVASTASESLRRQAGYLAAHNGLPQEFMALADGSQKAARSLASLIATFHRKVVRPQWSLAVHEVGTTYAMHQRTLADQGVDQLLNSLHPLVRWQPPILSIDRICLDCTPRQCGRHRLVDSLFPTQAQRLDGQGLIIVPSLFATSPSLRKGDAHPAVLVYPTRSDWSVLADDPERSLSLGRLLGATRAAALETIAGDPQSTSALARSLGVSNASASEHASVLRQAGLVATVRRGGSVMHEATAAGLMLLRVSA